MIKRTMGEFDNSLDNIMLKQVEFGLDFESRVVYLNTEISMESQIDIISRTNYLYNSDKNRAKEYINFYISSYGGDVYSMLGLLDYMRTFPVKINTFCQGAAMSAAAVILACGTGKRRASENSTIMFHQMSAESFGKVGDISKNTDHLKVLQKRVYNILYKRTKKDIKFWEKNLKEDFYLSVEDALKLNIIDEIIK